MLTCGALLVGGLVAGAAWSGRGWVAPPADPVPSPVEVARRFVWFSSILLTSGVLAGIAVIGGGGRLAMRLLAVTAGDDAQGRLTEAEEIVGDITLDGTIGFVVFNGIIGGVAGSALYLLVRRFLPQGRTGGILFGLGLLIVVGTTVDPLRADNPDFDIVGPGWLAAVVFGLVVVAFGIVLAGVAARMSAWLPLPSTQRWTLVRYVLPGVVAAVAFSLTAVLVVGGVVVVLATRWQPLVRAARSPQLLLAGRLVLGGVLLVASPNAIRTLTDIATR